MTECVKIKCDDCKFVEDCVDYGWDGCKKFTPKCPLCDGKGKYKNGLGVVSRCYYCLGTGKINDKGERNMTNEEWLRQCTTEQLAEWICEIVLGYHELGVDLNRFADKSVNKQIAVEWLKQPHTEKE